jgi:hypothetical protein
MVRTVHRAISTYIVSRAGFSNEKAKTGAVRLIQRFGSALNLNIHFHMLFLECAISENLWGGTTFTCIKRHVMASSTRAESVYFANPICQ